MNKKEDETTSPNAPGSIVGELVNDNSLATVKKLTFEDTAITFRQIDTRWRISLRQLAEYYDIQFKTASQKLTTNRELFQDLGLGSVTPPSSELNRVFEFKGGKLYDVHLSIRDAFSFLTTLNYKKYEDERRQKLIRMRNWLTDTAEKILTGVIPSDSPLSGIDPEKLECDYKSRSIANVARTRMLWYQLRRLSPHNPDTVNRTNAMYRHDYESMFGPHRGNLPKNWRKKDLDDSDERTVQIKELMEFGEFMHGNINQETVNSKVYQCFKDVFPDYMPKYLNQLMDKTTQTKLLPDGESA
jgi:hypothetical protein